LVKEQSDERAPGKDLTMLLLKTFADSTDSISVTPVFG